jgi:heme exporter protein A
MELSMAEQALSSKTDSLLEARGLSSVRGDRTLFHALDIELDRGEVLLVEGHNGSGKTTLLRMLCGLIEPTGGTITWQGEPIRELAEEYSRKLLYIGHRPGIKDELTAVENLLISATLDGVDCGEEAAWDALSRIGLRGFEDLPTRYLSQGQKRRVALARLLLNRAVIWVLDEPFVALDVAAVEALQGVIRDHVEQGGMVILTTHQSVGLMSESIQRLRLSSAGGVNA